MTKLSSLLFVFVLALCLYFSGTLDSFAKTGGVIYDDETCSCSPSKLTRLGKDNTVERSDTSNCIYIIDPRNNGVDQSTNLDYRFVGKGGDCRLSAGPWREGTFTVCSTAGDDYLYLNPIEWGGCRGAAQVEVKNDTQTKNIGHDGFKYIQ